VHDEPHTREILRPIVKSNSQYIQKIVIDTIRLTAANSQPCGASLEHPLWVATEMNFLLENHRPQKKPLTVTGSVGFLLCGALKQPH
jgi:hypothetical protein